MDKGKTRMSDQICPNKIGKVEVNKHDDTNQTACVGITAVYKVIDCA